MRRRSGAETANMREDILVQSSCRIHKRPDLNLGGAGFPIQLCTRTRTCYIQRGCLSKHHIEPAGLDHAIRWTCEVPVTLFGCLS